MPFPTLFQLAAKSVAQGIHDKTILLVSTLDTKSSNAIVRELLKLDGKNFKKLEVFKNQLYVTKVDLRLCRIDADAVRNLSNFNLVSLDFGDLFQLRDNFPGDPWDDGTLDIVNLLIQSTNDHSRRSLIHLGLSGDQEFIAGWEAEVSEFLPNLQSIDISLKTFGERFQFSNFCTCFPNLLVLDISKVFGLLSLQGIKNLKNLQKLTMRFLKFDDINGYKELSELKNLKYLDVSSEHSKWKDPNSIRYMLAAGVRMEALEFLDCSWTSVTGHELETFAKYHIFKNYCCNLHELSISLFSADIPDMIELFYNVFNRYDSTLFKKINAGFMFRMLEATVNAVRPGISIPDRVLSFVFDKTVDFGYQFPEHRTQAIRIICQALVWMSWEQNLTIGLNYELLSKLTVFLSSTFVL